MGYKFTKKFLLVSEDCTYAYKGAEGKEGSSRKMRAAEWAQGSTTMFH
jgi:hypothetical protein